MSRPGSGASIADRVQTQSRLVRKRSALTFGRLTASVRPLPDFLILGAQRSGTTSLARYLALQSENFVRPGVCGIEPLEVD